MLAIGALGAASGLPPVEDWHPPHCGDSQMRIAPDGTWFHQAPPIGRKELVRLFSTLLRKDDSEFVLVTPAEKLSITVEDAPFIAVLLDVQGAGRDQRLCFTTNVGDVVTAGEGNELRFKTVDEVPVPYLHVRRGLMAKAARPVYYQLADLAVMHNDRLGVWSGGIFFAFEFMNALIENPLAALRAVLPQTPSGEFGRDEFALYPEMRAAGQAAPIAASVLIPVIARQSPTILFTRRTEHLAKHGGQISFPGGRSEAADLSPVETALRETMEETGIAPAFVSIAGFLPRYRTGTGFDILPVVGVVAPGFALVPDIREVAEIFEVPLAFFLDPANAKTGSRDMGGKPRRFHVFEPDGHYIWGITAALLFDFAGLARAAHGMQT